MRPNTLLGFYVQDDYRATDRLTLNLGLRYEFYTIPSEMNGLDTTLHDVINDKFASKAIEPAIVN